MAQLLNDNMGWKSYDKFELFKARIPYHKVGRRVFAIVIFEQFLVSACFTFSAYGMRYNAAAQWYQKVS